MKQGKRKCGYKKDQRRRFRNRRGGLKTQHDVPARACAAISGTQKQVGIAKLSKNVEENQSTPISKIGTPLQTGAGDKPGGADELHNAGAYDIVDRELNVTCRQEKVENGEGACWRRRVVHEASDDGCSHIYPGNITNHTLEGGFEVYMHLLAPVTKMLPAHATPGCVASTKRAQITIRSHWFFRFAMCRASLGSDGTVDGR